MLAHSTVATTSFTGQYVNPPTLLSSASAGSRCAPAAALEKVAGRVHDRGSSLVEKKKLGTEVSLSWSPGASLFLQPFWHAGVGH